MLTKTCWSSFLLAPSCLTSFVLLTSPLNAQQYCVSGVVTAVQNCSACKFSVGNPVAMTLNIKTGSINCTGSGNNLGCTANASFNAEVNGRRWTTQNDGNPDSASVSLTVLTIQDTRSSFVFGANGSLSPLSAPLPSDASLGAVLQLSFLPENLTSNGTFPAALPTPEAAAIAPVLRNFQFLAGGATAFFSYTGQTCASAPPGIDAGGVVPLYSSSNTI